MEQAIQVMLVIVLGMAWGSFSTMATYRLSRGMPWIGDRPKCFMCQTPLTIWDYFSILSFFTHKGRCRYCNGYYGTNVSDLFTEVGVTIVFLLCYVSFGWNDMFLLVSHIGVAAVILMVIESETQKIPAKVLISFLLLAILYRMHVDHDLYGVLFGGIIGLVIGLAFRTVYYTMIGKPEIAADYQTFQNHDRFCGPAFDYVKLLGVIGVFLNLVDFTFFLICAALVIAPWYFLHKKTLRIGTIMTVIALFFMIYPDQVIRLYILL